MRVKLIWRLVFILVLMVQSSSLVAQGFSGLGSKAEGFSAPNSKLRLNFPRDHGPHPKFRIEWWYLTSNLTAESGEEIGVQWTLFRSALKPLKASGWSSQQLWMGHSAVTNGTEHLVSETRARGGIGTAGVIASPFRAWINDWEMKSYANEESDAYSKLSLRASGTDFSYDLNLSANGPLVAHGENGYSVKSSEGHASIYYSQPHYSVKGTVVVNGEVVRVSGTAWLDREWSSQPLSQNQNGWDWVSLNFSSGEKLMGFRLRQKDGSFYTSGTWISPNGDPEPIKNGALLLDPISHSTVAGRSVPTHWRLAWKNKKISVEIKAVNASSWMKTSIPYWEGPVTIEGTHQGRGYLEMTGY